MDKKLVTLQKQQLLDLKLPDLTFLQEDFYGDFYDYFLNFLRFEQLSRQISPKKMTQMKLFLYLDLHRIQVEQANYAYRLVFDHHLNFIRDETIFTVAGWLKEKRTGLGDYQAYENSRQKMVTELAAQLAGQNESDKIKHFNAALGKLFSAYDLGAANVAYLLA